MTREELLKKYRYINVKHDDWYEPVYDWFQYELEKKGIEISDIYFDEYDASFTGMVVDWDAFLASLGYTDSVLVDHAVNHWSFSVKARNVGDVDFDYYICMPDTRTDEEDFIHGFSPYTVDDFRSTAWFAVLDQYSHINFREVFIDAFKEYADTLHSKLMKEYEWLTSDEIVLETLKANDLIEEENAKVF